MTDQRPAALPRRNILRVVRVGALVAVATGLGPSRALSSTKSLMEILEDLAGAAGPAGSAPIEIELPPIHDDGSSVPLGVTVESPMTATDYVKRVRVLAPDIPFPEVADFHFTADSGKASVSTRIRLDAGDQQVLVLAELSDGSLSTASARIEVAVGGCGR